MDEKKIVALVTNLRLAAHGVKEFYDGLIGTTDVLEALFGKLPAKAEAKPEEPAPQPEPVTKEQVRTILAEVSEHNREGVRTLLNKYGSSRLSGIKPDDFSALYADAEALLNDSK